MAQYRDPVKCFSPLEVVERLLEIRKELGFSETLYIEGPAEFAKFFDAFGFDSYVYSDLGGSVDYSDYTNAITPGGITFSSTRKLH